MVLRHDPCDIEVEIPAGAKFQTGPVFWMHKGDYNSYVKELGQQGRLELQGRGFRL